MWKVFSLCLEISLFTQWVWTVLQMGQLVRKKQKSIRGPPFNLENQQISRLEGEWMRKAPKKIFKLENGQYIEIGHEEYQQLMQENPRLHFWMFGGMLLEIPEKEHMEMNRERSRRMYIRKLSKQTEEFSYESMTSGEYEGNIILDDEQPDMYELVEQKLISEELHKALNELSDEDRKLMQALYFDECSERAYAKEIGLSQVAVHKRKKQVLEKLRTKLV